MNYTRNKKAMVHSSYSGLTEKDDEKKKKKKKTKKKKKKKTIITFNLINIK